ncbi:hypothetical protein [Pseudoxanthomonas sp. X-1]|uniref:hypothetical protein n=1 Tax=Pseudoxanthomonas sp. X-1 TaxID=2571115 RepID=UPI00110A3CA0|nr:hypothetical protein [Pseudoxanthomonas sp. X-1]TMN18479.1 hypothetical protein FF950_14450 [Pseudoxanthomonas sp. X-1]UAY76018.1 hypothetical protein LAJ50_07225 [Pseudoxanthomonas sp. X-1]
MDSRLHEAAKHLALEFSLSRAEAQRDLTPMVLEGLVAHGLAFERNGRVALTALGGRVLAEAAR